jgi:predicted ferric reductase
MHRARTIAIWGLLATALAVPIILAAQSPLLAWRDPIYILGGFAGVVVLALLLIQPLLAGGLVPGLPLHYGRRIHRVVGGGLVIAVLIHVVALWITSPPDVIDILLFRSPTPFSVWGAVAMWAVFGAALIAALRRRFRLRLRTWRLCHTSMVVVVVVGSVLHAILIEGTMETVSKVTFCALVLLATARAIIGLRAWARRTTSR